LLRRWSGLSPARRTTKVPIGATANTDRRCIAVPDARRIAQSLPHASARCVKKTQPYV
jgi:hypothetical protein